MPVLLASSSRIGAIARLWLRTSPKSVALAPSSALSPEGVSLYPVGYLQRLTRYTQKHHG
jgi:hypothetical protein